VQLDKCLLSKKKDDGVETSNKQKLPWPAIIAVDVLVLLPFLWWLFNKIEQNKWEHVVAQLQAESGIVILNHHKQNGEYVVIGLRDPLSRDPADIVAENQDFHKPVKWQMQSYYSNENNIINRRLLDVLNPPTGVVANFQNGLLTIAGEAEAEWVAALPNKLPFIWGVKRVDTNLLREKEDVQQKILQLIGSIEAVVIEFAPNSSELSTNDLVSIDNVHRQISNLLDYVDKVGQEFKLGILGFADASGTSSANILTSEQRARNVHDALTDKGMAEDDLLAKGLSGYVNLSEFAKTLKCQSHRCVMFEIYIN